MGRPPNEAGGGAGRRARAGLPTPNEGAARGGRAGRRQRAAGGAVRTGDLHFRRARCPTCLCICGLDAPPEQRRDKGGFGGKKTFPPKDQSRNVAYSRPPLFLSAGTMPAATRHDAITRPERSDHRLFSGASRPTPRKPMRYQPTKSAGSLPTAGPPQCIGNDDAVARHHGSSGIPAQWPRHRPGRARAARRPGGRAGGLTAAVGVVAVGSRQARAGRRRRWSRALLSMPRR